MGRACRMHGEYVKGIKIWSGNPKGRGYLKVPGCRWDDNINVGY